MARLRRMLIAAVAVALSPALAQAAVTWKETFEGKGPPGGPPRVARPEGTGQAARFERAAGSTASTELQRALPPRSTSEGSDRSYAASFFVPRTLGTEPRSLLRFTSGGRTLLAFIAKGDRVDLLTYHPQERGHYGGEGSRLTPGRWHTVALRVIWSRDPARGLVEAVFDGDMMVPQVSTRTLPDSGRVTLSVGIPSDAPASAEPEVLFADDLAEAAKLSQVSPPFQPSVPGRLRADVEFARPGGVPLHLDAWVPKGPGPHPAMIVVHGGGFSRGDKQSYVKPVLDLLSKNGVAWFTINYRLAPHHKWPAPLEDLETAIAWVHKNARAYRIDPRRVAMFGESAGGFIVSAEAVKLKRGGPIAAVWPWYTNHAFKLPEAKADGSIPMPTRGIFVSLFGIKDTSPATMAHLRASMPLHQVHADMPPALIYHSKDDPQVNFSQSEKMCEAMKKVGARCDLLPTDGVGHGLNRWTDPKLHEAAISWLRETLQIPARSL